MKISLIYLLLFVVHLSASSQELQLHYDFRHSVDPALNSKNFPWFNFKYFKEIDTVGTGNFLLEVQTFLNGDKKNIGQSFVQLSQNIKFWRPKLYLNFYYSGGLGVTPSSFGFYISNSYGAGVTYPLIYSKTWISLSLLYRYSALSKPSHDPQLNAYIGGALFRYRLMYSNSLVFWTTNRDNGLPANLGKTGKKISFFADPQAWYSIGKGFSAGTRVSLYFHVLNDEDRIMAYPTIGLRKRF